MIKINDKFVVDSDESQFVLKELSTIQDEKSKNFGRETQMVLGYYSTLEQSLSGLEKILSRRAIKIKDYTLKEAIEELRKIHNEIFGCVKER
jgi:hypothetical protein